MQAYISVFYDENRATVTTSYYTASALQQQLRASGVTVTEFPLYGRFHWPGYREDIEALNAFCDLNEKFQFPDASALVLPTRSNSGGDFVTRGQLHHEAIRSILIEPPEWYKTFCTLRNSSLTNKNSTVICFGPERCVPPSMLRVLNQQAVHMADLNRKTGTSDSDGQRLYSDNDIAVVGMSCKVAGAGDVEDFWKLLCGGQSQHKEVPGERFNFETAHRELDLKRKWYGNFLDDYDKFDHKFFKKTPREVASMDPQQRHLLQIAYQAVEQSGYFGKPNLDKRIGCYVGVCSVDYEDNIACHAPNAFTATGNLKGFIAGKISHYFGWTGPGLTIDTACSSSAVAVHQACSAILGGECTSAIAAGTHIMTSPLWFQNLAGASFLSKTGACKPFDADADGYCRGEGVAAVYLKKLSNAIADGDQVIGVIAGTAVQQNQNCTPIVVPNVPSLSDLFQIVTEKARLKPEQITVVEAHGTGTPVGDPAEYDSVRKVLGGQNRSSQLILSSVKGLVGHCECTSGLVSLIKILLMINKGAIPPQASFKTLSPAIKASPTDLMRIPTSLSPWKTEFRAALINNYGASGSNASLVVVEAPNTRITRKYPVSTEMVKLPFWFCGLDHKSLRAYAAVFCSYLRSQNESGRNIHFSDLAFNLSRQSNRSLKHNLLLSCRSIDELNQSLTAYEKNGPVSASTDRPEPRPLVLCFGGQVSNFIGLNRRIYEEVKIFRKYLDQCDSLCISLGIGSIFPSIFQRTPIEDPVRLQTTLFALQYSCAKTWIDCGARPVAVVGHSFGELTSLCIAEALSPEDTLTMIAARARVIRDSWGLEKGAMMAIEADLDLVERLLNEANETYTGHEPAVIACFNGPRSFTLAGSNRAIDAVTETLSRNPTFFSMKTKKLNVTHAFHSTLVDPIMISLNAAVKDLKFKEPSINMARSTESASPGNKITENYVAEHMRLPVYFNHSVQRLAQQFPNCIWLEAGSSSTITTMASRALSSPNGNHFQSINLTNDNAWDNLTDDTLSLWRAGLDVSFWAHHNTQTHSYTPLLLPPYQFEKASHWLEQKKIPPKVVQSKVETEPQAERLPETLVTFVGYQDKDRICPRFRINTMTPQYEKLMMGHVVAQTAPICPATVQIDLAIEGLKSLLSSGSQFQPQIIDLENHAPICVDMSLLVWLDYEASAHDANCWDFRISSTSSQNKTVNTTHTTGKILVGSANDLQIRLDLDRYERLTGHRRCVELLNSSDADDIIQGRSIYKTFSEVVNYGEEFRGLQKLVGKGRESAGRVVKSYNPKTWFDAHLSDTFCQVGGIYVNCMTDRAPTEMYIAKGVEKWARSTNLGHENLRPESYDVLAYHQGPVNNSFLTDIFVFNPTTSALMEFILGIQYVKVGKASISKMLSRLTPGQTSQIAPPSKPVDIIVHKVIDTQPQHMPQLHDYKPAKAPKPKQKKQQTSGVDVLSKLKAILADLSGIEQEQITVQSGLADIGIDSLMGMELVREIEKGFKCTVPMDQAAEVVDVSDLLRCVQAVLGPDHGAPELEESEEDDSTSVSDDGRTVSPTESQTTPTPSEPVEKTDIFGYLAQYLGIEKNEFGPMTILRDLGVDSLLSMELRVDLASKFGLELDEHVDVEEMTVEGLDFKVNGPIKSVPKTIAGADATKTAVPRAADNRHDNESTSVRGDLSIPPGKILEAFKETKSLTDQFIADGGCGEYVQTVLPKQTQMCIALTLEAFEQLGCSIRSAKAGEEITLFTHPPEHRQLVQYLWKMLEKESQLIEMDGDSITRTDASYPTTSSKEILQDLLKTSPEHHDADNLTFYTGSRLTEVLTGKTDGIKLIFGSEEGRNLVSGLYGNWPLNRVFYKQMEYFLARLVSKLSVTDGPLKILEMGAGTGGTTKWLVPLLVSLNKPVEYTFTDLAPSFVAAARKRFKQYPFMKFRAHDIEKEPAQDLLNTQHIVIASNAVHATHSLTESTGNIRKALLPNGILMMLEMTGTLYWVDMIFGLFEGWWLFDDGRTHAVTNESQWKTALSSVGFGHTDWTDGARPENKVEKLIMAMNCETGTYSLPGLPKPVTSLLMDCQARQTVVDDYVLKKTLDFVIPASITKTSKPSGCCVLITGATGSVGSHLVANLVQLPSVKAVVCLNRRSDQDPKQRQLHALASKGIFIPAERLAKLKVFESDISKPMLGLTNNIYEDILNTVTHIIHNAWAMNAKRPLKGFESQFNVMRNMIDLARDVSCKRPQGSKVTFQFISSIAVVGHYPIWKNEKHVPEDRMSIEAVLPNGYGDAKYICELMLDKTLHQHPDRFRTCVGRPGQIAGSKISGYWNPQEHLTFLWKSSQTLKKLPYLEGLLSWTPVDDVAGTLVDLLFVDQPYPVYNIDNPVRQPWRDMLPVLADALDISRDNIIPFEEWVELVRNPPAGILEEDNPAVKLIDFLSDNFVRMSCGGLLLDTKRSREHSETLRAVGPVNVDVVRKYVKYWKDTGFLS